ncbi:hypothetical protein H6F86_27690 [Phormidium sp. FACHB-592]|uniref:Uncharacterized protein n=1 Tax=Stenomitos frigidus AS-A4 TaxID=2933935 RepID=A0ABV0KCN6_9CYAN|nr:hypothetical protein [Phormidium sp. FACHB-592]MBD2077597.1 hypothetical protein [Phormidium sp. FACHB-592]
MSTTKVLGLAGVTMATFITSVAQPAMAQRVCVESESNGRIVCGRVVNDYRYNNRNDDRYNDRYDSRYNNRGNDASNFDERFYLMAYPDVRAAIQRGQVRDAYTHYQRTGRFEGRFPRFNEASYLARNPDVAAAVRQRSVRSGYDHWLRVGRFEDRKL